MARLPKIGGDQGNWGSVLNEFLLIEHNPDGTLKSSGSLSGKQPLNPKLTDISDTVPINDDILQYKAGHWANRSAAQFKTDLGLTRSDVGLENVDNTADIDKPISLASQAALNAKPSGPAFIRSYMQKNYSHIYQTDTGWTDHYGVGTVGYDTTDYILGSSSIRLVTTTNNTSPCGMKRMLASPLDWRNKALKVWVKADDWSKISQADVVISTAGSFASSFRITLGPFMTNPTNYNGKWVELVLTQHRAAVQSGTPDWSTVNGIMLKAYGQNGASGTIRFNEIAVIDNPGRGMVSITFDDGHVTQFTNAKPILDKYGYKATNFTIPAYIGNAGYMSQEQTDILSSIGWDISGHYQTDLTSMNETQRNDAMKSVRAYLNAHGYKGSDIFAYPNGGEDVSVIEVVRQYFSGGVTIVDATQPVGYINRMRISRRIVHNTDTVATISSWIDAAIANNEWLVLCFHKITTTANSAIEYAVADFASVISHISTKDVPVLPVSDALDHAASLSGGSTAQDSQVTSAVAALSTVTSRWIRPYHNGLAATDSTPVAGRVMLYLMEVEKACTVDALVFVNGSVAAGNVTVGLYGPVALTNDTCTGAALISQSASTTVTAVNAPQTITLSEPAAVSAGKYYLAIEHDSAVDRYLRVANQTQVIGWLQYFDQAYGILPSICPTVTETGANGHGITARCSA